MKRVLMLIACALVGLGSAVAQSNEFVDSMLAKPSVSIGDAAWLILVASDNLSADADAKRAIELLDSLGWGPKDVKADEPITLALYSHILMKAFDVKGNLMNRLFPSPRYAYRSLCALQVIQGRSDPDDTVDGVSAIRLLGRVFDLKGVSE